MTKQNVSGNVLHKLSYAESTNQDDQFSVWNVFILHDVVLDVIGYVRLVAYSFQKLAVVRTWSAS